MLIKLLPIWATTIIFWTIHAQLASFSVQQASTMDTSLGNFQIPPASLYAFFIVSIMSTLAIYDRLIMPLLKKSRGSQGKCSTLQWCYYIQLTWTNFIYFLIEETSLCYTSLARTWICLWLWICLYFVCMMKSYLDIVELLWCSYIQLNYMNKFHLLFNIRNFFMLLH